MSNKVLIGIVVGFAAAGALAAARKGQHGPSSATWDRMRKKMEEMPADFPPRVMFDNVEATRANTEQILDLMRGRTAGVHDDAAAVATT